MAGGLIVRKTGYVQLYTPGWDAKWVADFKVKIPAFLRNPIYRTVITGGAEKSKFDHWEVMYPSDDAAISMFLQKWPESEVLDEREADREYRANKEKEEQAKTQQATFNPSFDAVEVEKRVAKAWDSGFIAGLAAGKIQGGAYLGSITGQNIEPWATLFLIPDTPKSIVETTYKTLMRQFHPDINKAHDASDRAKRINVAYEEIMKLGGN